MNQYNIEARDYLDLWKYFQGRADSIKENMFQSVTWVLGFAAAVLGFVIKTFLDFGGDKVTIKHPFFTTVSSAIGLSLCVYAIFMLGDFASHIRSNWDRADRCKEKINGLDDITKPRCPRRIKVPGQIWHKIGSIVILFALVFLLLGAFSVLQIG